ncbi:uncharacterized protein LOC120337773 isoform X2 [Styela clava]
MTDSDEQRVKPQVPLDFDSLSGPNLQTVCPVPPMPDMAYPQPYPYALINGGLYGENEGGNRLFYQGQLDDKIPANAYFSSYQTPYRYYTHIAYPSPVRTTNVKRRGGRTKSRGVSRVKYNTKRSIDKTTTKEYQQPSDIMLDNLNSAIPITKTGKKRGRKPGKARVSTAKEIPGLTRVKRKYVRRKVKEKPITDIVQLTESLVKLLLPPEKNSSKSPELDDIFIEELENMAWSTDELPQEDGLSEDDVNAFNDLIKELSLNSDKKSRYENVNSKKKSCGDKKGGRTKEEKSENKRQQSSGITPRKNILNCRWRAMRSRKSILDNDFGSSAVPPSTDTFNCKVGGKCSNKWQLLQRHVLGNKVVKQLREERQTERLIKVLCSTPQRTLRARNREEGDMSAHDTSATSSETASPDKTASSWISLSDTSFNITGQGAELCAIPHGDSNLPPGYFSVDGGICPDIEPTFLVSSSSSYNEVHNRKEPLNNSNQLLYSNQNFVSPTN